MSKVTYNGQPLNELRTPAPANPDVTSPDDRQFLELVRRGEFAEARRCFPHLYNDPHLCFLCQRTGQPAPFDDKGLIPPLTEAQLFAAIDYLEGPTKV